MMYYTVFKLEVLDHHRNSTTCLHFKFELEVAVKNQPRIKSNNLKSESESLGGVKRFA
jgi:hypothetical protein